MAKAPSLTALASSIMTAFPDLVAVVYPAHHPLGGYCNTDRKIPGTRLRRVGKGRRGSRLVVSWRPGMGPSCKAGSNPHFFALGANRCSLCGWDRYETVYEHNAAQTYRDNGDVVRWIEDEARRRKLAKKGAK